MQTFVVVLLGAPAGFQSPAVLQVPFPAMFHVEGLLSVHCAWTEAGARHSRVTNPTIVLPRTRSDTLTGTIRTTRARAQQATPVSNRNRVLTRFLRREKYMGLSFAPQPLDAESAGHRPRRDAVIKVRTAARRARDPARVTFVVREVSD